MLLSIEKIVAPERIREFRALLLEAQWTDGSVTAGTQSGKAKQNLQLPPGSPEAAQIGTAIYAALSAHPLFVSAALPARVYPPLFNCYQSGGYFDLHVDNAIRHVPDSPVRIRTDLSMTLFLSNPDEYDGGELVIEDTYGAHEAFSPRLFTLPAIATQYSARRPPAASWASAWRSGPKTTWVMPARSRRSRACSRSGA